MELEYLVLVNEHGEVIGIVTAHLDFSDIPHEHQQLVYDIVCENTLKVHLGAQPMTHRESDPSGLKWPVWLGLIVIVFGIPLLYFAFILQ